MLELSIPGFGEIKLKHLVLDFTGTLSVDGKILDGIKERLQKISEFMEVHVLTADTFGTAKKELEDIRCTLKILEKEKQDVQKEDYVRKLGADSVIAIGNGNNDRGMLRIAKVGVAVIDAEGCSADAILSANIVVRDARDALDLILNPKRMMATLRY